MRVSFFTNYMNHHQRLLADAFNEEVDGSFSFIATTPFNSERLSLGYRDENMSRDYIVRAYESEEQDKVALQHAEEDDYMIIGSAPDRYIDERLKHNKITFKYGERYFRKGFHIKTVFRYLISALKHIRKYQNKPYYYLCASAYTAADVNLFANFRNRTYKWGYFTEVKPQDIDALLKQKCAQEKLTILWVGRLLQWKHPQDAILTVKRLRQDGIDCHMDIIGNGSLEDELKQLIADEGLQDDVSMLGSMSPEKVREHMEAANIFLFTSDFNEGWGAVLNESMNSGCAVVASHAIGSVPFLIENGENGFIYKNADTNDLYEKVKCLAENRELREKMGKNAYLTMATLWNPRVAAQRFLLLAQEIEKTGNCDLFEKGPCSKAEIIKDDWM